MSAKIKQLINDKRFIQEVKDGYRRILFTFIVCPTICIISGIASLAVADNLTTPLIIKVFLFAILILLILFLTVPITITIQYFLIKEKP